MTIKYITAKEFLDAGYLQEVNRQFFHPLGLAMEVVIDDNGAVTFGNVWDYRDDPEGMVFGPEVLSNFVARQKAKRVADERAAKRVVRLERLGHDVQPVPGLE